MSTDNRNENIKSEDDFSDMPPLVEDTQTDTKNENKSEQDEYIDESESEEEYSESDSVSDSGEEEYEPMYILSDDRKPIRYSDDMQRLVILRDYLVKRETTKFMELGKIYVSHSSTETEDVTTISYMDRNLLWKSERLLKKFIIRRINKI